MFAKVFQKMLDSSVWTESTSTRIVWITFLLSMDSDGFCEFASAENVATRARVKLCHTKEAIAILESPDSRSKTPDDDGRRIQRVQGGWVVLNCKKYRDIASHGDLRKARLKSAQVVSSRSISSHLVSPTHLSTKEINKSLPEIEIEKEIETVKHVRPDNASDVARYVKEGIGLNGIKMHWLAEESVKTAMAAWKCPAMEAAERIVAKWGKYRASVKNYQKGKTKFLEESEFLTEAWRNGEPKIGRYTELLNSMAEACDEPGEFTGADGSGSGAPVRI